MKLDIENKILIPFLILVIIPILAVGIVSYKGSYHLFLENKIMEMQSDIDEVSRIIELNKNFGREDIINHIKDLKQTRIIIIDHSGNLVYSDYDIKNTAIINKRLLESSSDKYIKLNIQNKPKNETVKFMFLFKKVSSKNWYIGTGVILNDVTSSLLDIQKYTILVAIIFAIIAVELTIAIAHNLSKPIKKLADVCNKISKGDLDKQLNFKRKDEIGILAESFNNMIKKIKASTEELRKIKEINEDILRSTTTGIITIDSTGKVISINRAAQTIINTEDVDKHKSGVCKELIKLSQKSLTTGKQINKILRFYDPKGNEKVIEINTSLLTNEKGQINGALCSFNDITKRKKIEEKIEQINRLTSLGELAAGLAHEIRNPLTGIKTSSQVLIKRFKENHAAKVLLENILAEIDRMNKLISDILNFAKPREPHFKVTELDSIIIDSINLLEEHFKISEIEVIKDIPEDIFIKVDRDQFKQVFINLFMNSLKAMQKGGTLKITAVKSHNNRVFHIIIEDTGRGIPPKHLNRIFDPFFTTDPEGTGLGLSVVKRLVMQNNGEVKVISKVNKGTKFIITLPVHERSESSWQNASS